MLTNVDKCSKVGVLKNVEMKINLLTLVSNVKIYTLSPCLFIVVVVAGFLCFYSWLKALGWV